MAPFPIVCPSCGARYRLPDSFTAARVKCKQCEATIDVEAQRKAGSPAGSPAAEPVAAAAPAAAVAKTAPKVAPARQRPAPAAEPEEHAERPQHHHIDVRRARQEQSAKLMKVTWAIAGVISLIGIIFAWTAISDRQKTQQAAAEAKDHRLQLIQELQTWTSNSATTDLDGLEAEIAKVKADKTWQGYPETPTINGHLAKAQSIAAALRESKTVRTVLADIETKLAGSPTGEVLDPLFKETRPHTELDNQCTDYGGDLKKRFDDLKQRVEAAYVDALRTRAVADADTAKDGSQLASYGTYEDVVRKLREEANDAKDEAKIKTYGDAAKEIFTAVNRKVEELFTPEYFARVKPFNLLADPGNWELGGGSESVKFQFTGNALVMTNEGDANTKTGGIFYKAGRNWRDYVVELEFKLDAGAMTFYTRAEVMDTKHVPGFSIGKEKCDVNNIDYGKTMNAVISVIGGHFNVSLDGTDVSGKSNEAISINYVRKGPVAIAIKPGTNLTVSKFNVRYLR
jgi:predicted Zn finger-like uncharacterized protein